MKGGQFLQGAIRLNSFHDFKGLMVLRGGSGPPDGGRSWVAG
jgi:hypothetical protein